MGLRRALGKAAGKIVPLFMYKNLVGANRTLRRLLTGYNDSHKILNIGAGDTRYTKSIINMDIFPGRNVDVVSRAEDLPFDDDSFDLVICQDVIEHVNDLEKVHAEIKRIIKPGGRLYIQIPFMFPFHHSPDDHFRFTINGAQAFFKDFDLVDKGVCCGPTIALANAIAAWFSIALSFNIGLLRRLIWFLMRLVLTPLIFLDLLLSRLKFAYYFASEIYFIGQKRG